MSVKEIPSLLATHPCIFAVDKEYQIMFPVVREMLVSVKCGGEEYFNDSNGIVRSKCVIHRICVPIEVLDAAKEYTVCCRPIIDRKPYFPETEPVEEYVYTFRPLEKTTGIRIAHISDTHGLVDAPVAAAHNMDELDLLVMGGDTADHSGSEENMKVLYRIVSGITGGEIPCVFSRGNHDLRGYLAESLEQFTPNHLGRSYFTFRVGCVWGIVMDCGEDKGDWHDEYGYTVCCHPFRLRETKFLEQVIANAENEYAAEGVKYRLVLAHNPFTNTFKWPFDIEFELYGQWVDMLRENVKPSIMLCGHKHTTEVWMPGCPEDVHKQAWPVVISSIPNHKENSFVGAEVTLEGDEAAVRFVDSAKAPCDKQVYKM